jgi:hypothetical protein
VFSLSRDRFGICVIKVHTEPLLRTDNSGQQYCLIWVWSRTGISSFSLFKIVYGLYDEMNREDENRALGNWILARNFLTNIILTSIFTRGL